MTVLLDREDREYKRFYSGQGKYINLKLWEILYLAGVNLDDRAPKGANAASSLDDQLPFNRMTGATIEMKFNLRNFGSKYVKDHPELKNDFARTHIVVAEVTFTRIGTPQTSFDPLDPNLDLANCRHNPNSIDNCTPSTMLTGIWHMRSRFARHFYTAPGYGNTQYPNVKTLHGKFNSVEQAGISLTFSGKGKIGIFRSDLVLAQAVQVMLDLVAPSPRVPSPSPTEKVMVLFGIAGTITKYIVVYCFTCDGTGALHPSSQPELP